MKKWKIIALMLMLSLAAAGCDGKKDETTTAGSVASEEKSTDTASEEGSVSEDTTTTEETPTDSEAASDTENTEKTTVEKQEVVTPGLVPVKGKDLVDGKYEISVKSSSSMFQIERCTLTVKDGRMTAKMYMGGTGYLYLYPGTADEAERAPQVDFIDFTEEADGSHSFTFPVTILNDAVPCAAFSKKKELWYDRDLCFEATALPASAYKKLPYETVESLGLMDGNFFIDVTLTGGSGRASVESPAPVTIENGKVTATIKWSSSKYDFMIVDGVRYDPVNAEGENSTFVIPVAGFDYPLSVQADTTAMSEAHLIDYTLSFDSTSLRK